MAKFEKGNAGKPKGAKNKVTKDVKEFLYDAFIKMQGTKENLFDWGLKNPTEFYKIVSKLIPTDVKAQVDNKGELEIKVIRE
jgi:hypothetical protein